MLQNDHSDLHKETSQEPFGWEVVRLNLPEFIWLVSCPIVTDHFIREPFYYSFNQNIESVFDIISCPESTTGPTMVGLEDEIFKTKVVRWLENAILILNFANTVETSNELGQQLYKQYIAFKSSKII